MSERNIVTLSDVPSDLHQWFKDEARRRKIATRSPKRPNTCKLIVEALEEYRQRHTPGMIPEQKPVALTAPARDVVGVSNG